MLGGADNPNGELPSYITGADKNTDSVLKSPDMMPSGCIQRAGCSLLMLILFVYLPGRPGR